MAGGLEWVGTLLLLSTSLNPEVLVGPAETVGGGGSIEAIL